jgi:hypothetical protein
MKHFRMFQRKWTLLAGIERAYDSLGNICEEMRRHIKDSLTRSERFETNIDGSSKPMNVISFQCHMAIQCGVSGQESSPSSVWMGRQPHRAQVSYCSLAMPKNLSQLMARALWLHCDDSEGTNRNL